MPKRAKPRTAARAGLCVMAVGCRHRVYIRWEVDRPGDCSGCSLAPPLQVPGKGLQRMPREHAQECPRNCDALAAGAFCRQRGLQCCLPVVTLHSEQENSPTPILMSSVAWLACSPVRCVRAGTQCRHCNHCNLPRCPRRTSRSPTQTLGAHRQCGTRDCVRTARSGD